VLKKLRSLSGSAIQASTGAVSAIDRNLASLSRRTFVLARRSSINAAMSISGSEITTRNSWRERTFSPGVLAANGPRP
jgi:hypothetical protein